MVLTIIDGDAYVDNRESDEGSFFNSFLETFVAGRNVFVRNCTAFDCVHELVVLVWKRFHESSNTAVLTGTTSLLLVGIVEVCTLGDCLTVCNLWLRNVYFAVIFTFHTLNINGKVKLTHTFDDCLVRLWINVALEGWVLFGEAVQSL